MGVSSVIVDVRVHAAVIEDVVEVAHEHLIDDVAHERCEANG
jgi:hypothetical protein